MPRLRPLLALAAILTVLAVAPAATAPAAAGGGLLNGISGSLVTSPFAQQVGTRPGVVGIFVKWGSLPDHVFAAADRAHARLMVHLSTANGQHEPEVITPLGIARGQGDDYLLLVNRRLMAWGRPTYIRLMAEMNQADNTYAGFDRDGTSRGRSHSPATFRRAWQRFAIVVRGGPVATIDARLARLHLPPLRTDATELGRPQVAMVWVPQTRGTPDIAANLPRAYWPGGRYVDWVGTDFYSRYPNFTWLTRFYRAFRGKPFAFGEWALWGADDPRFVRRLFGWVRAHPRVRMMLYNQGQEPDGPFRLWRYPRAAAEVRRQLAR